MRAQYYRRYLHYVFIFQSLDIEAQNNILRDYSNCHIDLIKANYLMLIGLPKMSVSSSEHSVGKAGKGEGDTSLPATSKETGKTFKPASEPARSSKATKDCLVALSRYFSDLSACDSLLETRLNCELQTASCATKPGKSVDDIGDDVSQCWRKDVDIESNINALNVRCANYAFRSCASSSDDRSAAASGKCDCQLSLEDSRPEESR